MTSSAAKGTDDGPAFPTDNIFEGRGMSLRDWFATHAPSPTNSEIDLQYKLDKMRNPYNEPRKPPHRDRARIIADLAFEYADAMLAARAALAKADTEKTDGH